MRNSLRNTVAIQIVSDLHLETPYSQPEYDTYELPVKAPHLALLGDIGSTRDRRLFEFLEKQLLRFETVFFLLGNHEPYGSSWDEALEAVLHFETENGITRVLSPEVGRFVLLDRIQYDIPKSNVTVLGCTLFSYVPQHQYDTVSLAVNDFSSDYAQGNINGWTVDTHNAAHSLDLNWLNAKVIEIESSAAGREVVILTHHSPTKLPAANRTDYLKDDRQILSAFATDLSRQKCWRSPQVRLWCFGHTHFNCDFVEEQTGKAMRVVTNQKGYGKNEAPGFDPGLTVRLGSGSGIVTVATERVGNRFSYPGSTAGRSGSMGGSKRSSHVASPIDDAAARSSTSASNRASGHRSKPSLSSSKRSSNRQGSAGVEATRLETSWERPDMDRTAYNKALRDQKLDSKKKKSGCCCCSVM